MILASNLLICRESRCHADERTAWSSVRMWVDRE